MTRKVTITQQSKRSLATEEKAEHRCERRAWLGFGLKGTRATQVIVYCQFFIMN